MAKFKLVPIEELKPGDNTRQFFEGITELASLIDESEWVQTLLVQSDGTIIAGERRYRACKHLNDEARRAKLDLPWPKLPCMVESGDDEDDVFDLNVAENAGRVNLRYIEWARIMSRYRVERGLSNVDIGRKTGFSDSTVSTYISILEKTNPDIIKRLDNGEQIPVNILIRIHQIRDKDVQLLRLNQWLGTSPEVESETKAPRQRIAALSRKKQLQVLKMLEESGASDETIQVVQFMVGQRQTMPHKWHQKLSRRPARLPRA